MALSKGIPVTNAAPAPLDGRKAEMAQYVANADGSPRTGVLGYPGASILTPLGSMNVQVGPAEFVVSKGKSDGVVTLTNDGNTNVPIAAAPGTNSRITVIWVKQNDNTTGDANSTPVFGTTDGAAAASPTKPALATGQIELGTIRVYAGTVAANGGSNVTTNTFQMTAARGGVVPFRTKADLDAWTTAQEGQLARVNADGIAFLNSLYERESAAWASLSTDATPTQIDTANSTTRTIMQRGSGKVTGNGTIQVLEGVTFPVPFAAGTFPHVQVTAAGYRATGAYADGPTLASTNHAAHVAKTNAGFTAIIQSDDGNILPVSLDYYYDWFAIGVPA